MTAPKAEHVGQPKGWLCCGFCYQWRPPQFVQSYADTHKCVDCIRWDRIHHAIQHDLHHA